MEDTQQRLIYFSLLINREAEFSKRKRSLLLPETHIVQLVDWEWLQEARRKADYIYVPPCLIHTPFLTQCLAAMLVFFPQDFSPLKGRTCAA